MNKKVLFLLLIFMIKDVYAYLDPSSGSTIIGSIWPLILSAFSAISIFVVKHFWKPIKKGTSKIFIKK